MIITYIYSQNPADALRVQLRCRNFADAINRIGWHSANLLDLESFIQNTQEAQSICAGSDLLVIHRYLYGPVLQAIEYWKARDKKVIVDFDQAINYLTPDIPIHSFWLQGEPLKDHVGVNQGSVQSIDPSPLEQFKWGLGLIDAAVVSSMRLVVDWSPFTDVYEIPDYLNTDQYLAFKQPHDDKIRIGLAYGARCTSVKNSGLATALNKICRIFPNVELVVCGVDDDVSEMLEVPSSQLIVHRSNQFDEWAAILLKLDIGLVPIYGDYDLRLSRINLLEFMISKTPWIASGQPSFREFSRYGRLVDNSADGWELSIIKAMDNIDKLQTWASGEPFLFALSQDVNENIDKVVKLFTYILNKE
jgi:glycosyltransferase involved in cell wall biosynthesis